MSVGVAIVGAGLAGLTVAQMLRAEGYDEKIVLIGEEAQAPYDRTTLSKSVLAGDEADPPSLAPPEWFEAARVELITGRRVAAIDPGTGTVHLDDGPDLKAAHLVLATGAAARKPPLPGVEAVRVFLLRDLADVRRLQQAMQEARRIAIIGGGLIGCEVATTARKLGRDVVLIESAGELLQRVLGAEIGRWCRSALLDMGVECHLGSAVQGLDTLGSGIAIRTERATIEADLVLICVGAVPNDALARQAGLLCDRGVLVDAAGRTSAAATYAVGDVACWPLRDGSARSLETWLNSQAQAEAVARVILGQPVDAVQEPLSWTEIAGQRIQVVGDFAAEGEFVARGDLTAGSALIFRLHDGQAVAALGVNVPKDFAIATRLVAARIVPGAERLGDPSINLRGLLPVARA